VSKQGCKKAIVGALVSGDLALDLKALRVRSRGRAGRRPARARDRARGPPKFEVHFEVFGRGSATAPTIED
jgi:hypothetical protein